MNSDGTGTYGTGIPPDSADYVVQGRVDPGQP